MPFYSLLPNKINKQNYLSLINSLQPSVDSLAARIFTESSRQKKTVLLQNGETSTLQMQHKMTQIQHNHFFVKYQRKSKIFIEKQEGASQTYDTPSFFFRIITYLSCIAFHHGKKGWIQVTYSLIIQSPIVRCVLS